MNRSTSARILLVARKEASDLVAGALSRAGHVISCADNAARATESIMLGRPDLLVIDSSALGARATKTLTALAEDYQMPVLNLDPSSDAAGLCAAVDSLFQGVEPVVGRLPGDDRETVGLTAGRVGVDMTRRTARVDDRVLSLTAKEFDLLCHFVRRPGRVWSREQLLDLVWGYDFADPRVVTVHVGNLRKKLAAATGGEPLIETVRNFGYRLGGGQSHADVGRSPGPPFVGRESEINALRSSLMAANDGRAQVVLIVGEPGIGKTRLAEELAVRVRDLGGVALWGRCQDEPARSPFAPWLDILASWQPGSRAVSTETLFPEAAVHDGSTASSRERDRRRVLERLAVTVREHASRGLTCLIMDDLQWADTSTLRALQHLIRHLREVRLLLVLTHRPGPGEIPAALTEIVSDIAEADSGLVLSLEALSSEEVAQFAYIASRGLAVPELSAEIYRVTEGSPFFLVQLCRVIELRAEWSRRGLEGLDLSRDEGVHRFIASRLVHASPSCRTLLKAASVFGREFTTTVVTEAAGISSSRAAAAVSEALETRMVHAVDGSPQRLRFAHSLMREVLYNELSTHERVAIHSRAGALLERMHEEELDLHSPELAYHYCAASTAGYAEKAVDFSLKAGRLAAARHAWDESCAHWQTALDLLDLLPAGAQQRRPVFVAQLLEELGDMHSLNGEVERTVEAYEGAAQRVPSSECTWLARLKRKQGLCFQMTAQHGRALSAFMEAEAELRRPSGAADESWWQEWLEVQLEQCALEYRAADFRQADCLLAQITETFEKHGSPHQKGKLEELLWLVSLGKQRFVSNAETMAMARRASDHYLLLGSSLDLLKAQMILAVSRALSPADEGGCYGSLSCYLESARRNHDLFDQLQALALLALWHRRRGEVDQVVRFAREAARLCEGRPIATWAAEACGNLAWAAWRSGDLPSARKSASDGLKGLQATFPRSAFEWVVRWPQAGLSLLDGDSHGASVQIRAMLDPTQQRQPRELEESSRVVAGMSQGSKPVSPDELVDLARRHGYL